MDGQNMKLPLSKTMTEEFMEAVMDYRETNRQIYELQSKIRRYDLAFEAFFKECEHYSSPLISRTVRCNHQNTEVKSICTIERCPFGKGD